VLRNRLDRDRARDDKRQWVRDRRARTRHLIELGGLVQKAGVVELVDDDRATLLGALLELAGRLREAEDEHQGEKAGDLLIPVAICFDLSGVALQGGQDGACRRWIGASRHEGE